MKTISAFPPKPAHDTADTQDRDCGRTETAHGDMCQTDQGARYRAARKIRCLPKAGWNSKGQQRMVAGNYLTSVIRHVSKSIAHLPHPCILLRADVVTKTVFRTKLLVFPAVMTEKKCLPQYHS